MEVIYCQTCHECKRTNKSYKNASAEIEKILNVKPDNICNSYCGPGEYKHFVAIDDEIIEDDSLEALIEKLKKL